MDKINSSISSSEKKEACSLLLKVAFFVPVLAFVAFINTAIDPSGMYKKIFDKEGMSEYRVARELASGKDVRITSPIDDRLLRKYSIEDMTVAPDIIVLGSSHSEWIGENIFPGRKIVNDSVPAAVLADYLGIFEGYAKKNLYPQRVVLLLDPQLIGFPVPFKEWLSISDDTYRMLGRLGIRSKKIRKPFLPKEWLNLFSFSYFQESINEFFHEHVQDHPAYLREIFRDGRWATAPLLTEPKVPLEFREQKVQFDQVKPDKELEDILEKFIRYLTAKHIKVTLYLLPFQPSFYKECLENPQAKQGILDFVSVENYYRGLAGKLNLDIVGSYDAAVCGLGRNDFIDTMHVRHEVLERILEQNYNKCSLSGPLKQ